MTWWHRPIVIPMSSRSKTLLSVSLVAGTAVAGLGLMLYQISKVLFNIVRECDYEARKLVHDVGVAITNDYTGDVVVPDDLEVVYEDEAGTIYSYGVLQTLYFRRTQPGAAHDWEWSFDQIEWFSTADLSPDESSPLDPPNLIFLCRLHLASIARRKGLGRVEVEQQSQRIPAPLDFSDCSRDLSEAPDELCCPITGMIMAQPVCTPSGKTHEYATLVKWIARHGTDPNTHKPMSLLQVYPNLVLRNLIEAWARGDDVLGCGSEGAGTAEPGASAARGASDADADGRATKRLQQEGASPSGADGASGTPTSSFKDEGGPFVVGRPSLEDAAGGHGGARPHRQWRAKGSRGASGAGAQPDEAPAAMPSSNGAGPPAPGV